MDWCVTVCLALIWKSGVDIDALRWVIHGTVLSSTNLSWTLPKNAQLLPGQLYRLLRDYLTSGGRYAETDCASKLAMQRLTLDMTGVVARHKRGVQNSTRQVKVDFHARHFGAKRCAMVCLALIWKSGVDIDALRWVIHGTVHSSTNLSWTLPKKRTIIIIAGMHGEVPLACRFCDDMHKRSCYI